LKVSASNRQLLAQGCSTAQLAHRLHRSPKTVDRHVCSLFEKLDVHSRTEAVAAAYARGIVSSGNHLKPNTISRLSSAASERIQGRL
jgi:IS30 family transposase